MNIDRLMKLARLANENPNENEANLAARRVCLLLKEADYKLPNQLNDGPRTWNDVRRSNEPFWRSKPPNPYADPNYDPFPPGFWERFKDVYARAYGGGAGGGKSRTWEREPFKYGTWETESPPPPKKPKVKQTCSVCNKEYDTTYNKPEPFVCGDCQWMRYHNLRDIIVIECCECGVFFNVKARDYEAASHEFYKRCESCKKKPPYRSY